MANRCHITVLGVSLEQGISKHSITHTLLKSKNKILQAFYLRRCWKCPPVGVETKLRSLHDVGCHSFND